MDAGFKKQLVNPFLTMIPATAAGFLCCVIMSLSVGEGPLAVIGGIIAGSWGTVEGALTTLSKVTPLLLNGLAVALSYQAGLLNIGCEGQLTLGALTTATVAVLMPAEPGGLTTLAAVMAGSLMGGLWALPVIWLREKRGVHEVISSLLLNYVAIYLADYLVRGPLGDGTAMARTAEIPAAAAMVPWGQAGTAGITLAPFVALFLTLLFQVWVYRTTWGYEVRAIGINALAAARAGITVTRWSAVVFSGSGVLAGLAGALEVAAVHHRFYAAFSPGYGFDGIAVAFLVKGIPGWLWLSSLLLATLRAADKWLQIILDISPNAVLVIEAVILLAVTCQIHGGRLLERLHAVSISKTFREKP